MSVVSLFWTWAVIVVLRRQLAVARWVGQRVDNAEKNGPDDNGS